jgi:hypothetical protein
MMAVEEFPTFSKVALTLEWVISTAVTARLSLVDI